MKCAPFLNKERAVAKAAKEQEEEIAPKIVERLTDRIFASPICWVSLFLGTNACIIALML